MDPGSPLRGVRDANGASLPTMRTDAGDLDHRAFRDEACAFRRSVQALGDRARRRLTDRTAALADEKHHRRIGGVIVDAGEEGVAALDPVHEALDGEKIQRAVNRDRRRSGPARCDEIDDLVGAERLVARGEDLEYMATHRGQPLPTLDAERFG